MKMGIQFNGIDVSHHNGAVDWGKVKASGVDFAMLRACYGWDNDKQIDRQFSANAQGCQTSGIPYGLYHYSYAVTPEDAKKEAAFFLRVIGGLKPEYPVAFDFEERAQLALTCEQQLAVINVFIEAMEAAGYYAVLYMSASPLEALWRYAPDRVGKYDAWVAHVNTQKPSFSGSYGIWQYSWKGRIDGVAGDVDLDYGYRDYPSLIKNKGLNGWTLTPPAPQTVPRAEYDALEAQYTALSARFEELQRKHDGLLQGIKTLTEKYE